MRPAYVKVRLRQPFVDHGPSHRQSSPAKTILCTEYGAPQCSCSPMGSCSPIVQEAHIFKLRLPGLKEDLQIQVEDDRILYITYSNQPKEEPMKEAEAAAASTSQPKEQTPGSSCSFMRKFKLPENADLEQIEAEITNETLTVTVPKRKMKSHEARKINVRDGAVAAASAAANASASTA